MKTIFYDYRTDIYGNPIKEIINYIPLLPKGNSQQKKSVNDFNLVNSADIFLEEKEK